MRLFENIMRKLLTYLKTLWRKITALYFTKWYEGVGGVCFEGSIGAHFMTSSCFSFSSTIYQRWYNKPRHTSHWWIWSDWDLDSSLQMPGSLF